MNSMPFLLFNLGSEMIYILDQRLKAQSIRAEKAQKVLQDVTKTMFNQQFIDVLMKPQPLYSNSSAREIFDRLAHSSIMRLSTSSMDKLYDLMTMGLKYQLIMCSQPSELIQLTLNHIDSVLNLITSKNVQELVENAKTQFLKLCQTELDCYELIEIREALFDFFQDKNIKVSLFLSAGIQNTTGTFVLHQKQKQPIGYETGSVGTFVINEEQNSVQDHPLQFIEEDGTNHFNINERSSDMGFNLYLKKNKETLKQVYLDRCTPFFKAMASIHGIDNNNNQKSNEKSTKKNETVEKEQETKESTEMNNNSKRYGASYKLEGKKKSSSQLNLLASMIGGPKTEEKKEQHMPIGSFMLNLFPTGDDSDALPTTLPSNTPSVECVQINSSTSATLNTISSLVGDFDDEPSQTTGNDEEENDLLDLMDSLV